ncbi:unnamed protein product [Closterium sp. NIES-53]
MLPHLFVLDVPPVLVLLLSHALTVWHVVLPLFHSVLSCLSLPCPLLHVPDPESDLACAATFSLVTELVDFAARSRLDYIASLVTESESVCPPSVGGEPALSSDVLEDRQFELECLAAALPHFPSMLLCPEGDPDALDIPTPRSYAEAITGEYSSQWQTAMDAEMASWKPIGTYVDEVSLPEANIFNGMWIFRVKWPPSSLPAFKARYVAQGFSQRQGVDFFQTFSPTPKMTTLQVVLHVVAQRYYELHSLDFSTNFLQGSLHEEIWLRCPPGFTGSFPAGTQWSLRRLVYSLRQAPREWHNTLRTTLAALGFAPSSADPSLFLRTDTTLSPFYILVYAELEEIHTCTDLGGLRSYLGLQITQDRARRSITLTQLHMAQKSFSASPSSFPRHSPLLCLPATRSELHLSTSPCEAEIYTGTMAALGATLADLPADRFGGAASFSSSSVGPQQGNACLVSRAETGAQNEAHFSSLLPCADHFLALDLTDLAVDLLQKHLLAAETSIVAVGAAHGTARTPFFEGCSPYLFAPSYVFVAAAAAAAAADIPGTEEVEAASAPSGKRRNGKGKGGKSGGGGSRGGGSGGGGGGGGGSGSGGGSGGFGGGSGGSSGSGGGGSESGGSGSGGGRGGAVQRGHSGGGQKQQQQRPSETPTPQQLCDRAGKTCGKFHTQHRCFSLLENACRAEFGDEAKRPRWLELLRSGVDIFALDYDAILAAMYALTVIAESDYCLAHHRAAPLAALPPLLPCPTSAPPCWLTRCPLQSRAPHLAARPSPLQPCAAPAAPRSAPCDPPAACLVPCDAWLLPALRAAPLDSVSLFDHASGASSTPPAIADSATRSQWLTRDAAARLAIRNHLPLAKCANFGQHRTAQALCDAIVARYSSPATAALGRLLLPYLFPGLSAFAIVEDLVTHLRTINDRYRAALLAEFLDRNLPPMYITLYFIVTCLPDSLRAVRDHFLALNPTVLIVDLFEQHLLAVETSVVADIKATSASGKRRSCKDKGGRGGGGGSGGGGGGSSGGDGGSGVGGGSGSGGRSGGSGNGGGRAGATQRGGIGGGQREQQCQNVIVLTFV